MNKIEYKELEMVVVFFDSEDVITDSTQKVVADAGSALQETNNLGNVMY